MSAPLFEPDVPPGLLYRAALIDVAEEAELLHHIEQISFSNYEMRGVVARRRVAYFGHTYEGTAGAKPITFRTLRRDQGVDTRRADPPNARVEVSSG